MSLWMELVPETLHISPALVFCSSVGARDTPTCSFCRLGGRQWLSLPEENGLGCLEYAHPRCPRDRWGFGFVQRSYVEEWLSGGVGRTSVSSDSVCQAGGHLGLAPSAHMTWREERGCSHIGVQGQPHQILKYGHEPWSLFCPCVASAVPIRELASPWHVCSTEDHSGK